MSIIDHYLFLYEQILPQCLRIGFGLQLLQGNFGDVLKRGRLVSLKVYSVVDEMFLAGEIRETSQIKVLKQLTTLTSLE